MRPREHTLFRPAPELPKNVGPAAPAPTGGPIFEPEEEERASLVDLLVFAVRAAQRRRRLALVLFLAGLAFTAMAARLVPRTYESTARMLVVHTPSSAGGVGNAFTADDAKRDAKEFEQQIYARSNLEGIVKDAHLVARWDDMRQPLRKILDLFASSPSEQEKVEALVLTLEKAIHVTIDASAITISVDWMERTAAQDIAAASLKRFSDARWAVEVAAVADSIGVLDGHVKAAREAMAAAAAEVLEEKGRRGGEPTVRAARGSSHRGDPMTDARIGELHRKLQDLNEQRRARLAQLENHLAELSGTYGPQHPAIVALKSQIDAARRDTPDMASLRAQEAELMSRRRADRAAPSIEIEDAVPAAPSVDYASSADRFEAAQRRYEALVGRIDAANIEKQVAEVTFKRKYEVVHPADLPLGAKKPVVLMTMVGGILASLLLVLAGALAADAWSGILFEPKRVRDDLGLPILGEVKLS